MLERPKKPGRPKKLPPAKDLFLQEFLNGVEAAAAGKREMICPSALVLLHEAQGIVGGKA